MLLGLLCSSSSTLCYLRVDRCSQLSAVGSGGAGRCARLSAVGAGGAGRCARRSALEERVDALGCGRWRSGSMRSGLGAGGAGRCARHSALGAGGVLPRKMAETSSRGEWILERLGSEGERVQLEGRQGAEVTMGRGLGVTHRILARSCPLMVSRNHCTFRLTSEGHCLVIDNQSLNGVWVNGQRIEPQQPHQLSDGDVIQLGVPLRDKERAEYEYRLTRRHREQEEPASGSIPRAKGNGRVKRKHSHEEEVGPPGAEGAQSCKTKIQRLSPSDSSGSCPGRAGHRLTAEGTCPGPSRMGHRLTAEGTQPGPSREGHRLTAEGTQPGPSREGHRLTAECIRPGPSREGHRLTAEGTRPGPSREGHRLTAEGTRPGPSREGHRLTAEGTQPGPSREGHRLTAECTRPGPSREGHRLTAECTQPGPSREGHRLTAECIRPGPSQMRRVSTHSSPSGTLRTLSQVQAEVLSVPRENDSDSEELGAKVKGQQALQRKLCSEWQLSETLPTEEQERKELEAALRRQRKELEDIIRAKDRELEESKVKVQKDHAAAQLTDVLENELQCIICSEHFIEAVTLNCSHSFCCHCILEWRKRKEECPICRQTILSQTRSVVLDNCIERMLESLSEAMRARRLQLIKERKALKVKPLSVPDSESSCCDDLSSTQSVSTLDSSELEEHSDIGDTEDEPSYYII
ncbi:E3 ubiquitin-protein ligase rnf8 [Stegostoma tigrinum]|uniref:E3 ubiquitin-protein ligase rnf8 n=1 Tax=Stegostoma tigrinum TaxID=3053191 RepID=UPI00287082C8|nr:E3 ubiquitin-protein ligase rnf8 [Stegostoma tigrinum]